jgi:hypothetical protein
MSGGKIEVIQKFFKDVVFQQTRPAKKRAE